MSKAKEEYNDLISGKPCIHTYSEETVYANYIEELEEQKEEMLSCLREIYDVSHLNNNIYICNQAGLCLQKIIGKPPEGE